MEKCLIEVPLTVAETKTAKDIDVERLLIKEIKGLAMQLSRYKPADWNKFLDVVTKWAKRLCVYKKNLALLRLEKVIADVCMLSNNCIY